MFAGEPVLGEQSGLDPLGKLDLLCGVEQRDLADLLEVVLDRIGRGAARPELGGRIISVIPFPDRAFGRLLVILRQTGVPSRMAASFPRLIWISRPELRLSDRQDQASASREAPAAS